MTSGCTSAQRHLISNTSRKPLHLAVFRSIEAAGKDWDVAAPQDNIFLQRPYLSVLEANPPKGMRFAYMVFYRGEAPAGVSVCQVQHFNAGENIQDTGEKAKNPCFFNSLNRWFKRWVAAKASAELLVCGNLLLSGEYGYYLNPALVGKGETAELLENAWQEVIRHLEREGYKVPVVLLKDITNDNRSVGEAVVQKGFAEFEIQPGMRMELPYENFDAYLSAMSTKYRTRAKRAFKKAGRIEKIELGYLDIQRDMALIHRLYLSIANNAGFNMVDINPHYLPALKKELGDQFRMFAYKLDGQIVAFYTVIHNGDEIEAHFLGYDRELNHDRQIYLNVLYDIIRYALSSGARSINFARTALEIKSSVGAVPQDLYCYIRHQNPLYNRFTGRLLDYVKPVEIWKQRHPFKSGAEQESEENMQEM